MTDNPDRTDKPSTHVVQVSKPPGPVLQTHTFYSREDAEAFAHQVEARGFRANIIPLGR